MIKGFMKKKDLLDYLNQLGSYQRKDFIIELIEYTNYLSARYLEYKSKIYNALYENFDDDKYGILSIETLSKKALEHKNPKKLNYDHSKIEYSDNLVVDLYNNYLEIVYKSTTYFSRAYTISNMFATMAYACGDFPIVEGVIVGVYGGKYGERSRNELQNKFFNMILVLNNTFDNEWIILNKFDLYKLQ